MSATLSEETADIRIEGDVTGQIAIGDHIVQVMADRGAIVNVTPPQEQIVPRRRAEPAHRLPRPFPRLIGRQTESDTARAALAAGGPVEFHAEAGWGKSALLRFLAHQQQAGPDGVIFDRAHDQPTDDILQSVFESLYEADGPFKPTPAQLREYLQGPEPLVVLDDLDAPRDGVQMLLDVAPRARFLLAARERNLWGEGSALALGGLVDDAGLKLFERELGRALAPDEVDEARAVCRILDGHPLRILQAAAVVRSRGRSVADVLPLLSSAEPATAMAAAMTDGLDAPERAVAGMLAALGGTSLSSELVAAISGISTVDTVIESLLRRGVAREDEGRIRSAGPFDLASDAEERSTWRRRVIAELPAWLDGHRDHPGEVLGETELIDAVIGWAFENGNWNAVVDLGQRVAPQFLLGARWGSWARVVRRVLHASRMIEDHAAEAWSLNELALHIGLWEQDLGTSVAMLARSVELWSSIGDEAGASIARHNRAVLSEPPPPPVPPEESGPPRRPNQWRRGIARFLMTTAALIGGILAWSIMSPNTLAVALRVDGSGAITSMPSGIDCPGTCSNDFEGGSSITFTAVADDGWTLVGWTGACTGTPIAEPCHLKLVGDASVGATFAPVATSPTVAVEIQGSGTITSDPAGIACPSQCANEFASGTTVSLSAHPDPGWKLARWGGACRGTPIGESCVLDRKHNGSVTASFANINPDAPAITVLVTGGGSVITIPSGRDCRDRCMEGFRAGTDLILTADPDEGWKLSHWSGACAATPNNQPCALHVSKDETVGATFVQIPIPGAPSVAVQIRGSGGITSDPGAIDCPGTCSGLFAKGAKVNLTADPEPGWELSSWGGACGGTAVTRHCVLFLTKAASVSATFSQIVSNLSVTENGQGTVTSNPGGIDCPSTCSARFVDGTKVILTADPVPGWELSSWGEACGGTAVTRHCVLVLTKAASVSATFSQIMWNLSVTVNGQGTVTSNPGGIDCPGTCSAEFPTGTKVTLTADPNAGWQPGTWGGSCSGTPAGAPCVLILRGDTSVSVAFAQVMWPLRVTVDGQGTITSNPSGMRCRDDCTASFPDGTRVTLTNYADQGWDFLAWGGACKGTPSGQPCVLIMKGPLTATASFRLHVE